MRKGPRSRNDPTAWALWRRNGVVWAALLALLALSYGMAILPLGSLNTAAGPLIALVKASLVMGFYMELRRSGSLVRLAALAGLTFVLVFFALTLADVLSRIFLGWRA